MNPKYPDRVFIDVYVGFDSEYVTERIWEEWSNQGGREAPCLLWRLKTCQGTPPLRVVFQELDAKTRKQVKLLNKTRRNGFKNSTLSYQLSIYCPKLGVMRNIILMTQGRSFKLSEIVSHLIEKLLQGVVLPGGHPVLRIFLISHYSLAEMQTFTDFHQIKREFDSIRGTPPCAFTMGAPYELCSHSRVADRPIDVELSLQDTALLAPAGHQNLASLGTVVGLEKLDVGASRPPCAN